MKKFLTVLSLAAVLTSAVPRDSHAIISQSAGVPLVASLATGVLAFAGLAAGSTWGLFTWYGAAMGAPGDLVARNIVIATGMVALGVVMLDDTGSAQAKFVAISNPSDSDLAAYNVELDQINAIAQNIQADAEAHAQALAPAPAEQQARVMGEFIRGEWNLYGQSLSPQAFAGVQKVSALIRKSLSSS